MLKADFFDLLITDVRMPRLSGPALVRRLSAMEKTLPSIIFVMLGHGSAIFSISKGASLESLPEYSRACRACRPFDEE
jgi:FixJ family two-component response regulator